MNDGLRHKGRLATPSPSPPRFMASARWMPEGDELRHIVGGNSCSFSPSHPPKNMWKWRAALLLLVIGQRKISSAGLIKQTPPRLRSAGSVSCAPWGNVWADRPCQSRAVADCGVCPSKQQGGEVQFPWRRATNGMGDLDPGSASFSGHGYTAGHY